MVVVDWDCIVVGVNDDDDDDDDEIPCGEVNMDPPISKGGPRGSDDGIPPDPMPPIPTPPGCGIVRCLNCFIQLGVEGTVYPVLLV